MNRIPFARYASAVLACNLFVVVWGAYVRASRSGDGCGSHWPTCNGRIVPVSPSLATVIEYTHRVTSGAALFLVVGLVVLSRRAFAPGHPARKSSVASLVFMLAEALLGAGLVLLRLVAGNTSVTRALYLSAHLINTFMLLGSLALSVWWGAGAPAPRVRANAPAVTALAAGALSMLVLAVSGVITALGDTLFPVRSLSEGFAQDIAPTAHFLLRLRLWHPVLAVTVGGYVVAAAWGVRLGRRGRATGASTRLAAALTVCFGLQLGIGVANVFLLAPVGLQLVHLLVADLLWISLVLLCAETAGAPSRSVPVTVTSSLVGQ